MVYFSSSKAMCKSTWRLTQCLIRCLWLPLLLNADHVDYFTDWYNLLFRLLFIRRVQTMLTVIY